MSSLYENKTMLAPMVRVGTLPTRLLALRFGADVAYTEEVIDFKMLKTTRVENELLGTVDFVTDDGTVAFRTCAEEKSRVVFQMGTSHPKRALRVAQLIEKDVAGIDINMGCPKTFSVSGGMGAALLRQPELVKSILTELVTNMGIPVTCKIRCLDSVEETIEFAKMAQATGIRAIGVHGRTKEERQAHKCRHEYIKQVAQSLHIPVIANGGSGQIKCFDDIEKFRLACGASSVMIARAAQWNVSIFRQSGLVSKEQLIKEYIKIAIDYDNHWTNTKYCIQQILGSDVQYEEGTRLLASKCGEDIYVVYNMMDYYKKVSSQRADYMRKRRELEDREYDTVNKVKVKITRDVTDKVTSYESNYFYNRKESDKNETPKMALYSHFNKTTGLKSARPTFTYDPDEKSKRFKCVMEFDCVKYFSNHWYKRKIWAEHAACQIYMWIHEIGPPKPDDDDIQLSNGQTTQNDLKTEQKEFCFGGEAISVSVTANKDGEAVSYSTSNSIHCDTSPGISPMDILCQHLLYNKIEEPEYDSIENGDGKFVCTMRHRNVEYSCTFRYNSKKEATNSVIQLYILIHKISPSKHKNKASTTGETKRQKTE